ncbi:hypothetical protein C8R43DRAFT_1210328 [Mycena crocata]|nr:hypothetical protein C8R43DRAFT_1210328 [Mycena crocata]
MSLTYGANRASRLIISTVAPDELREMLTAAGWEDTSDCVRKTVKYQLSSYASYKSAPAKLPGHLPGIPSLGDLAAIKLPDTLDTLDDIPDIILSRHIWGWHGIPYATFRGALFRLSDDSNGPPMKRRKRDTRSTEILAHEKYLGDQERLGCDWRHSLVMPGNADAVFPMSTTTGTSRTIGRPTDLPGYAILDAQRPSTVDIQPSTAAFTRAFDRMTDGLLKSLDCNNVFVAGGIVLGALLAVDAPAGQLRLSDHWKSSDIDIYLYGRGPKEANAKLQQIFAAFRANLPPHTPAFVVRNSKTITFYSRYPLRRVQIVLKLVKSPRAVLLNFDLDVCAMGWDGKEVWMLPRAARALETGYTVFTVNMIQGHYLSERRATQEQRVFKYANKVHAMTFKKRTSESFSLPGLRYSHSPFVLSLVARLEDQLATASRVWTKTVTAEHLCGTTGKKISHRDLENRHQASSEPQGRSCLSGFTLFMRHVALWKMERYGEISVDDKIWASTEYNDYPHSILAYDDTPSYTWGEDFDIPSFQHQIDVFELRQVTDWPEADRSGGMFGGRGAFQERHDLSEDGEEFISAACLTYGPTVTKRGAGWAGLKVEKIITPAVKSQKHLIVDAGSLDTTEGIFLWRIGRELMWQQPDRRIDESVLIFRTNAISVADKPRLNRVFEALYSFYRINDRTDHGGQSIRLITQLSRRAIQPTVDDESGAFARWIGWRPIFVNRFYTNSITSTVKVLTMVKVPTMVVIDLLPVTLLGKIIGVYAFSVVVEPILL